MNTVQLSKHFAESFPCSVLMIGSKLIVSNHQGKRVIIPGFKEMSENDARNQLKMTVKTLKLKAIVSAVSNKEVKEPDSSRNDWEPTYEEMFG